MVEYVPWDVETDVWCKPGFVWDVCRLGRVCGVSWRGQCSPGQGCGGLDMLSTAVSEWGGPCFAEEGDWRRGSLALTCTEHPPSP